MRGDSFLGLDLTQLSPKVFRVVQKEGRPVQLPCNYINQVVLPYHDSEELLFGKEAYGHRRGKGDLWPKECEAPFGGDIGRGVGAWPMCMVYLGLVALKESTDKFSGQALDYTISWMPEDQSIAHRASRIICESVNHYAAETDVKIGLVVPDSFEEGLQQLILDAWKTYKKTSNYHDCSTTW